MPLQIAWVVHTASALAPLCSWHSTSVSVAVQSSAAREFMPCRVFASTKGKEVEQSDGWSLVCSFMPLWNNKHLSVVEISDFFSAASLGNRINRNNNGNQRNLHSWHIPVQLFKVLSQLLIGISNSPSMGHFLHNRVWLHSDAHYRNVMKRHEATGLLQWVCRKR